MTVSPISLNRNTDRIGRLDRRRPYQTGLVALSSGSQVWIQPRGSIAGPFEVRLLDLSGAVLGSTSGVVGADGWFRWDLGTAHKSAGGIRIVQVRAGSSLLHAPVVVR